MTHIDPQSWKADLPAFREKTLAFYAGELDKAAIIAWCRSKLANYKVPRHVEFRTELPKSAIGKVLRRALREEEEARAAARARRHAGAAAEEAGGEA